MYGGYPIATEALDLEVYVLAALFAASPELAALESENQGLSWTRRTFEASEISRRLISLAVMLRSMLDASLRGCDGVVGHLLPDAAVPSRTEVLTLREACNKVIHARQIDLSPGKWEESEAPPVSGIVVLKGTHRGQEWLAELDAMAFLNEATKKL